MYHELNEQELAGLCSQNDRQAKEELYIRYAARLYTLCRRYSGSADDAKDLMQDVLIKVFDKISTFKYFGKGSLYAWISRVAVNAALNDIRGRKLLFISLEKVLPDSTPDPLAEEVERIPHEKLLELISGLPQTQRAIFNMYCIEKYSHKEIAAMLNITETGSASMLAKARARLKKRINDYIRESERND